MIEPFPESALNEQAGKMLLENYEEYARLARYVRLVMLLLLSSRVLIFMKHCSPNFKNKLTILIVDFYGNS